jgi:site-specific DNA recombinase
MDELLAESTERVKEKFRKKMDETSLYIEELHSDIEKKRASIQNLESQNINSDEIVNIFQSVGKVIKLIEDKERKQSLVRKLVSEMQVEDKRIKEVHFSFSKKFSIGGGKESLIISK